MEAGLHLQLVRPAARYLPEYAAALRRGWSPDNLRPAAAAEEMQEIAADPAGFLRMKDDDPEGRGGPVKLPDGSVAPRLPGLIRWLWDGAFCGSIGLRWQRGTAALPPHVLGHIGYAVVPWKRGHGYATRGLALMLGEARAVGLPYVDLTTDPDNPASQKVITANGGRLIERFCKPAPYGADGESLRYRITLGAGERDAALQGRGCAGPRR